MNKYVIYTDSTADLSKEMIRQMGVYVEPMTYIMDGKEYLDKPADTGERICKFYDTIRSGSSSSTSQINSARFCEIFSDQLIAGYDVIYIAFSSALSGTYLQAKDAADTLKNKYPDRRVEVIDSKSASLGEGLLVYYAATMKSEGKSMDEVIDFIENNKLHLCHWFTVDDLNHLKRGGRISPTVALIGTMLGIKPILHVDDEGRLINVGKVRGRQASLDELVNHAKKTAISPENQTVFISHGDSRQDAEYVAKKMQNELGVKDVKINYIGPVVGTHSGPGTIALFFLGEQR